MNDPMPNSVLRDAGLTISHQLATYAAGIRYADIPAATIDGMKRLMLDTLAVSWAGSDAPGCREAHALVAEEGGRADSTAWAYGGRLPAASAAFINGMSSSALDYDSIGVGASVHKYISVLPAALAVAEREHASGEDFLTALAAGTDITYRLAAASDVPNRGFHYAAVFGVLGAAAAAARLLKLDALETRHAIGIAFIQACGTQQANIDPSLTKRMLSAFSARAGVYAAQLAQRGITAPAQPIEGKFGLYRLYQNGDPDKLLDALGTRFESASSSIKMYPSCGCNHTTIAGMLDLIHRHDLKADDVESVDVTVTPYIERIVGGPYDPSGDAQVAAQFSIRYTIACLLVRRKLGLAEIQADAARDPEINRHVGKVNVLIDQTKNGFRGPVALRIKTRMHGEISTRVEHVPGSPQTPVSDAEIQRKFDECFRCGVRPLNDGQLALLTSHVRDVERIADMSTFFSSVL